MPVSFSIFGLCLERTNQTSDHLASPNDSAFPQSEVDAIVYGRDTITVLRGNARCLECISRDVWKPTKQGCFNTIRLCSVLLERYDLLVLSLECYCGSRLPSRRLSQPDQSFRLSRGVPQDSSSLAVAPTVAEYVPSSRLCSCAAGIGKMHAFRVLS